MENSISWLISNTNEIPHGRLANGIETGDNLRWGQVLADTNEIFWIFGNDNVLYKYNIRLGEVTYQIDLAEYKEINFPTLTSEGNIVFDAYPFPDKFFVFQQQAKDILSYKLPSGSFLVSV